MKTVLPNIVAALSRPLFLLLYSIVIIIFAYSNTFDATFHFDDQFYITDNIIVRNLEFFADPSQAKDLPTGFGYHTLKMRYVGLLSFALNYQFNGLDVTGYHIVNVSIHIVNTLLIYYLVMLIFRTPAVADSVLAARSKHIALFTALLFGCHPVQTQAVTYISQRFTSLAATFYLLSLASYGRARLSDRLAQRSVNGVASVVFAVLAMKTKEIAFTLPFVLALYEFTFFNGSMKQRLRLLLWPALTTVVIPLSLMDVDKPFSALISEAARATRAETMMPRSEYFFTELRVIVTYLRLLVLPTGQNLDYDYPISSTLLDAGVLAALFLLLFIAGIGAYLLYRSSRSSAVLRLPAFGIFWFFLALSVESSFIPTRDVIFEHRLYLPSFGAFFAFVSAAFLAADRYRFQLPAIVLTVPISLMGISLILAVATYQRNIVWKNDISLWSDVVEKSPNKARGYHNLGFAYLSEGQHETALHYFSHAISLKPDYAYAYNNRGGAYEKMGLYEDAIRDFTAAVTLDPDYSYAFNNRGNIYRKTERYQLALEDFSRAIALNPSYTTAIRNRGRTYTALQNFDKAIDDYSQAIRIDLHDADAFLQRGVIFASKGNMSRAIDDFREACSLGSNQGCVSLQMVTGTR